MSIIFAKISFFLLCFVSLFSSELFHKEVSLSLSDSDFLWEQETTLPFDEGIFSWEATRPNKGYFLFRVSLFINEWTPFLDYAFWGKEDQHTFQEKASDLSFKVYQDIIETLQGKKASGFKILIEAKEGASLQKLRALHFCATNRKNHRLSPMISRLSSTSLPMKGLSQMTLPLELNRRLCSPTSTTCVLQYLLPSFDLSALSFAESVKDFAFDIYGNWVLNTAQASHFLGPSFHCFVARLTSFDSVLESLKKGFPVVVSLQGPLSGSALPYEKGHLLVISGYDAKEKKVLCRDPAFPSDEETHVSYALEDFLAAWSCRSNLCYLFYQP